MSADTVHGSDQDLFVRYVRTQNHGHGIVVEDPIHGRQSELVTADVEGDLTIYVPGEGGYPINPDDARNNLETFESEGSKADPSNTHFS